MTGCSLAVLIMPHQCESLLCLLWLWGNPCSSGRVSSVSAAALNSTPGAGEGDARTVFGGSETLAALFLRTQARRDCSATE